MIHRQISKVYRPKPAPGFLGPGHIAIPVIGGLPFEQTDPFILLMDDQLHLPGKGIVGGAHPHAGFETVTLVLEGDPNSRHKTLQTGGLEWMTAGSGIVHTEEIDTETHMRILQLWLVLPKERRWAQPRWQELHLNNVPVLKDEASEIRIYSGTHAGMTAPTLNETPTTIIDFRLNAGKKAKQEIPATYNGFIYVIDGSVTAGESAKKLEAGDVGWLENTHNTGASEIDFTALENGARFVFYAGEPQGAPIVQHGPFVGDTQEDIIGLYRSYRAGEMGHVKDLPAAQVIRHVE